MGSASRRSLERASIHSRSSELLVHVPRLGVELLGKFRARLPASIVAGPGPSLDPLYDLGRSPILIASTAGPRAEHGHSVGVTGLRTDSFVDENPNPLEADPGLGHRPDGGGRDRMVDRDAISGAHRLTRARPTRGAAKCRAPLRALQTTLRSSSAWHLGSSPASGRCGNSNAVCFRPERGQAGVHRSAGPGAVVRNRCRGKARRSYLGDMKKALPFH